MAKKTETTKNVATATETKEVAEKNETIIATVTGGNLNIRPEASTKQPPVGRLSDGQEVEVIKKGKEWSQIKDGYVMTKFLKF